MSPKIILESNNHSVTTSECNSNCLRERGYHVLTIESTEGHWIAKINSEVEGSWLPNIRTTNLTFVVGKDRPQR